MTLFAHMTIANRIFLLFTCIFAFSAAGAQTLNIEVTDIRNTDGNIRLVFYKTAQSFDDEEGFLTKEYSKAAVKNGKIRVSVQLPAGNYGIALLDDENADDEMDYNWIGMPTEGFGFSDYYHSGLSRPTYSDFDFNLPESGKSVTIKIRYIN